MGSPISNTIAEIFLQHHENTYIKQVLDIQYVQYYTRYVDDIVIIYNNSKITHEQSPNKSIKYIITSNSTPATKPKTP